MPHSYTNLVYHIVFSTKYRKPLITPEREDELYRYIGGTIQRQGGTPLKINGIADHVHVLARLRADKALSSVLRELKSNSTGWMHEVFPEMRDFSWQRGYGAFTVSPSNICIVSNYIARQKEHHFKRSSRDEFISLLRKNRIEFDDRDI